MIVAIVPDRFSKRMEAESFYTKEGTGYRQDDVRRPMRGIQLKNDSYATMRMMLGDGTPIQLVNAGSRKGTVGPDGKLRSDDYSNFLIQAVSEDRAEKQQVVETFGEAFIFFFGERPRVLTIQGVLLNTFDFNWEAEWWHNYENYLRGTKCVQHDARIFLTYEDTMVSGYIMACSSAKNAQERNHVPLSFQLFVTDYVNISAVGDPSADQTGIGALASGALSDDYRPMLIPKNGMSSLMSPVRKVSLIEQMTTKYIDEIQSAWNMVSEISNNALLSMDSMLGNPLRVPIGFEGALMFDDKKVQVSELPPGVFGTKIQYSTFGENSDEFVQSSSPYASSDTALGGAMWASFSGFGDYLTSEAMVVDAAKQWGARGFLFPPPMLSKVITLASKTDVGMQVIGSGRKVVAGGKQARSVALSATAPVVAGTTEVLGDVALADSIAQDAGVDSDAFLTGGPVDRAQIIQDTEKAAVGDTTQTTVETPAGEVIYTEEVQTYVNMGFDEETRARADALSAEIDAELGGVREVTIVGAPAGVPVEQTRAFIESQVAGHEARLEALKRAAAEGD